MNNSNNSLKKLNLFFSKIFQFILLIFIIIISFDTDYKLNGLETKVYLGGESIGLEINSGIFITGMYKVETNNGKVSPWEKSDIVVGDMLVEVEDVSVNIVKDVQEIINSAVDEIDVVLLRDDKLINTEIDVVQDKFNKKTVGLYLKDTTSGIGTLSFVYNGKFASLAHSINNQNMEKASLNSIGNIRYSNVIGVRKGTDETVGEKRATMTSVNIGSIYKNSKYGVYGSINDFTGELIEVAGIKEVKLSDAQIVTVIKGNKKEYFDCEVIYLVNQKYKNVKGIKIKITDRDLIDRCGGIIQGMSGSPIIQNGKLIGAVSHVTTDDPTIGYGLYAEWMLQELA